MTTQSQKGSATIVIFIVILLTLGGAAWYFKNVPLGKIPAEQPHKQPQTEEVKNVVTNNPTTQDQKDSVKTYKNTKYGFEFTIPTGWRISADMSAYSSAVQIVQSAPRSQYTSMNLTDLSTEEKKKFNDLVQQEVVRWKVDTSPAVILTNLSEQKEKDFFQQVKNGTTDLSQFPHENSIFINVYSHPTDMNAVEKDTKVSQRKYLVLNDNLRGLYIKAKSLNSVTVQVPLAKNAPLYDGGIAKTLSLGFWPSAATTEENFLSFLMTLQIQ
ncbi:MAG: hypothetical protein HYT94_04525 [Parcubacteria group bacterium]|nr:hypothetical protein [Parcubacteria group bacterium]